MKYETDNARMTRAKEIIRARINFDALYELADAVGGSALAWNALCDLDATEPGWEERAPRPVPEPKAKPQSAPDVDEDRVMQVYMLEGSTRKAAKRLGMSKSAVGRIVKDRLKII